MTSSTSPPPVTDVTAPPETIVGDAANQHRATSYVVGATTLLWDRVRTPRQRPGLREIAVGAVFEAEDVARVLLGGVRRAMTISVTDAAANGSARVGVAAQRRMNRLAARGSEEEDRGQLRAASLMDALIHGLATAPIVERVVDAQVDRLLRPVVATVLDDVLSQMEHNPERLQGLIRGQRDSMVTELVGRLRQSTVAGDTTIDRITSRILRRGRTTAAPAGPVGQTEPVVQTEPDLLAEPDLPPPSVTTPAPS